MKIQALLYCLFFSLSASPQSFTLVDKQSREVVTNDTVAVQAVSNNGWVGYESLDLYLIVSNNGPGAAEIGVRKTEVVKPGPEVLHTFCFAENCYDTSVYVSPFHVTLPAAGSDSSFLAHFLFDNRSHPRGVYPVIYTFYNVNDPSDSVHVFVRYNSVASTSLKEAELSILVQAWPVPASQMLKISWPASVSISAISLLDTRGQCVLRSPVLAQSGSHALSTVGLADGVYQCAIQGTEGAIFIKRIVVMH